MKIYLMRHGQTTGDIEDRYGGDYEDHLTEEGRRQAKDLAQKIKNLGIEKIFYSPRIRATETAAIVGEITAIPTEKVENLKERNSYGVLTGVIKSEAQEKHPDLVESLKNPKNTITGAEDYLLFKDRILKTFNELSHNNYKIIGLITHGGPIHCFFREVMGYEVRNIRDCAVIELEKNDTGWQVLSLDGAQKAEEL